MKKSEKRSVDWNVIIAIFVSTMGATTAKHFLLMDKVAEYSIWKDYLLYMVFFLPLYLLALYLLRRRKK